MPRYVCKILFHSVYVRGYYFKIRLIDGRFCLRKKLRHLHRYYKFEWFWSVCTFCVINLMAAINGTDLHVHS